MNNDREIYTSDAFYKHLKRQLWTTDDILSSKIKPKKRIASSMIILWIIFTATPTQAQSSKELFAAQQRKLAYIYGQEHGGIGKLIHGKVYEAYLTKAKNDPFWLSADWTVGSMQSVHLYYPELLLKYDAHKDALVFAADLVGETFIWVNENQVESFWIQERQFDYLGRGVEKSALKVVDLSPGYFELLYEGNSKLYVKREKRFQEYRDDYDHVGEFYEKSVYLLMKDQTFWLLKGKKELIQFANDHEDEMEEYLKQKGIRFRSISDEHFVELITYYDSL